MGIQELIVAAIVLGCVVFVARKYVFKPKSKQQSCGSKSGCGKCGGGWVI